MTYPGQEWPGQPQPGGQGPTPGNWPGAQQQPTGPYQQPYPGQRLPGQPPYPPTQYPVGQAPVPPKRRRGGVVAGVIVAVVVLVGGGVGTWFAFNHAAATGSASPQQAATKLLADVSNNDVLGVANDLPPAEAALVRDTLNGTIDQLKRLNVVQPNASAQTATGMTIHTSGITFDNAAAERINDHLTITKLVAGQITIGQAMSTNGLTSSFLHTAFPNGVPSGQTHTVDIGQVVRQLGHPIRIATVDVNGQWYPSLFYSIADAGLQAAHQNWPTASIPAVGAASADDAVRQFAQSALDANVRAVIEETAPDEMAALHDAGQVLVDAAGQQQSSGYQLGSASFTDRNVAGGVDVVVQSLTLTSNADKITISQSGGCYSVQDTAMGHSQRICASNLTKPLQNGASSFAPLPSGLTKVLQDMVTGVMNNGVGVVATQVDGQWYVSPGRTITQLMLDLYGTISQSDFAALLQMGQH